MFRDDYDRPDPRFDTDPYPQQQPPPQQAIPPGYWLNPQTGQIEPTAANLATPPQTGSEPDFNPNVNYDSGPWSNGQPTNAPAGWRWDQGMARFVQDAPASDQTGSDGNTFGQGGGGSGAGNGAGFTDFPQFNPSIYQPGPAFQPQQFQAPTPFSYGDFSYDAFKAPTLEEAQNQPGYLFALQNGQKALENSAAARGVLRTGGTLKDLFSWGDKFGEQNYGNVFNQDLQGYTTNRANAYDTYNTNRNNAADTYRTNYGVSKDVFDTNYGASKDAYSLNNQSALDTYDRLFQAQSAAFNPNFQAASLKFSDLYNRDRDKLNALTTVAGYGA